LVQLDHRAQLAPPDPKVFKVFKAFRVFREYQAFQAFKEYRASPVSMGQLDLKALKDWSGLRGPSA
jgi:hypothetical protein